MTGGFFHLSFIIQNLSLFLLFIHHLELRIALIVFPLAYGLRLTAYGFSFCILHSDFCILKMEVDNNETTVQV